MKTNRTPSGSTVKKAIAGITAGSIALSGGYFFSQRSVLNLRETREPLQIVAECAIRKTPVDFVIVDGGRTKEEQKINVANGKSWTMRSRHIEGAAIDFAAIVDRNVTFAPEPYKVIYEQAFLPCSQEHKIPIVWGGTWKVKDLMHIELDRKAYP